MAQQETGGGTGEPDLTEEVQAQPEAAKAIGTETPALNRAERRAQAQGKKAGGAAPAGGGALLGGARGPNPRTTGQGGATRIPRTGNRGK